MHIAQFISLSHNVDGKKIELFGNRSSNMIIGFALHKHLTLYKVPTNICHISCLCKLILELVTHFTAEDYRS